MMAITKDKIGEFQTIYENYSYDNVSPSFLTIFLYPALREVKIIGTSLNPHGTFKEGEGSCIKIITL